MVITPMLMKAKSNSLKRRIIMKKLLTLLLIAVMLTSCAHGIIPAEEPFEIIAEQTHQQIQNISTDTSPEQLKPDIDFPQEPDIDLSQDVNIDFGTKRLIVNTEIENIKNMQLDGLLSVEPYGISSSILIFSGESEAEAANEVFLEASIFSEPDILVKVDESDLVYIDSFRSWGVTATGMDEYQNYLKAQGGSPEIIVAVLDTGIDAAHPMLRGRVISGWNFVNGNTDTTDRQGHGTHVAGTIAESTLGNVKIMPVKVLGDNGYGFSSDVVLGIRWAADNGAKVINMSLGGYGNLQASRDAIRYANSKGCVVVVAAGNSNDNASLYDPAWVPEAITVAAHDIHSQRANFSNYGNVIDLSGPGVAISSAVPGSGYQSKSGTSMSAPHVSAAVALLMSDSQFHGLGPDAIQDKIKEATDDYGTPGFDIYYGHGGLNAAKLITQPPDTEPSPPPDTEPSPPPPGTEPSPPPGTEPSPPPPGTEPSPPPNTPPPSTPPPGNNPTPPPATPPPGNNPTPPPPTPNPNPPLNVGDIVKLGGYDWRVLEVKDNKALVLSEKVITKRQYHSNRSVDVTWANSDLRTWLNGSFYNTFSATEKTRITQTSVTNQSNQWHGTEGGNSTTDRLFILSMSELVKYFGDSGQLASRPNGANYINDQFNSARVSLDSNGRAAWLWIRSPGNNTNRAATTNLDGDIDPRGNHVDNNNGGIRPAMWITNG